MAASLTRRCLRLTVLLLIAGCAGAPRPGSVPEGGLNTDAAAPLILAGLPPLPESHGTSSTNVSEFYGRFTFDRSANALDNGDAVDLLSGISSLSWGIWRLNPPLQSITGIEVVADVPADHELYIAVSDFQHGGWQIDGPLTAGTTVVPDEDRHRSPEGVLYLAAVAYGGSQPTVHKLILTLEDGWTIITVDSDGFVGPYTSLALISGRPAISYYDSTNGALKFASSSTTTGSAAEDWAVSTVDSGYEDSVGYFTSLAVVENQPAISYYDEGNGALRYARRNLTLPPNPPTWTRVTVDTDDFGTDVGYYTSLAVVNGRPLISYYDVEYHDLRHAQSLTPTGTSPEDWATYITSNYEDSGRWCSLAVVDGKAAVSYAFNYTVSSLYYEWFPAPGQVSVAIASGDARGTALAVVAGRPAISWTDSGDGMLKYSYSSTLHGTANADWSTLELRFMGDDHRGTSLAVIDGRPAISFMEADLFSTDPRLAFAWSTTPDGQSLEDWQIAVVDDSTAITGAYSSLAEIEGKPAISYHDADSGYLKYAIRLGP